MLVEESEKSLRAFVKSSGSLLKQLCAEDVLRLGVQHWLATQVDGARPETGDGLVAYFEMIDRGRGLHFEFGLNRIMTRVPDGENHRPWIPAHKLRLSMGFKATLEIFQLNPLVRSVACWSKDDASAFLEAVRSSAQFQVAASRRQASSGISLSACEAPWGGPDHPTRGLTWATA